MMAENSKFHITVNGQTLEIAAGTSFLELAEMLQGEYEQRILLVQETTKEGQTRLRELHHSVQDQTEIKPLTILDQAGYKAYVRSMTLLLHCAAARVIKKYQQRDAGEKKSVEDTAKMTEVKIHFVVSDGLFCTMTDPALVTEQFLQDTAEEMHVLVKGNFPIRKKSVSTGEAAVLFAAEGMPDKERLMHYRRASRTNLYSVEEYSDYHYGYMVHDTSCLQLFALQKFAEGFVLRLPAPENPLELPDFAPDNQLFSVQNASRLWGEQLKIETVADLNDAIVSGKSQNLLLTMEAYQEKRIAAIAEQIASNPSRKIVMIAGPSSSGKTTFSHRLSAQLSVYGLTPHPVPVDDYFKNREDTPKNPDGSYNFECLEAIDIEQFNKDMCALLAGEQVELPVFNFKTGKREYKGKVLQLGDNDILVIEGIHCLNDALSYKLPQESKFKIYISALTQLNLDEHNRIATTDGRMLRRIVRDARTRGTSAEATIKMWPSVRAGEENYIFPFQESADVMFNSALIYELAVLKIYAEPLLFGIPETSPQYVEAKRMLKFLEYFVPMAPELIPNNSLVREFIGGGCFDV